MECKFWLHDERFDIDMAYGYRLSANAEKEIRKIIFQHFDYILTEWRRVHGGRE